MQPNGVPISVPRSHAGMERFQSRPVMCTRLMRLRDSTTRPSYIAAYITSATLVWALIASLYIGNVMLLVLNLPMVGLWVKLLKIPKPQLYAGILIFATVGAYGMRQSSFDLFLLYGIGLLGVLMRRFDFPTAPVVVGMILGPLAEAQMRNAVSIGEGSWLVFVQRPMSLTLLIIVLAVLILPRLFQHMARRKLARLQQLDA